MKKLPKIPVDVAESIYNWVDGNKLKSSKINKINEFYKHLGLKWDSNTPLYRGLSLSPVGFEELMITGKIKLKKRPVESWSCDFVIAKRFSNGQNYGAVLRKQLSTSDIILDLQELYNTYENVYAMQEYSDGTALDKGTVKMFDKIRYYGECEILTKTICTNCDISDLNRIRFLHFSREDFLRFRPSGRKHPTVDLVEIFAKRQKVKKTVTYFISNEKLLWTTAAYPSSFFKLSRNKSAKGAWELKD